MASQTGKTGAQTGAMPFEQQWELKMGRAREFAKRVQLKNVKYFEAGSEETYCYVASLYIDGKRRGTVSNEGHGGSDFFDDQTLWTKTDKGLAPYPTLLGLTGGEDVDLELAVGVVFDEWLAKKDEKRTERWLKARLKAGETPYRLKSDPDSWRCIKGGKDAASREAHIRTIHTDDVIEVRS